MDGTLIWTSTLCQSRPGSNGNEVVLHTLQICKTGSSPSDPVLYHNQKRNYFKTV